MKQYIVQFTSGTVWQARSEETLQSVSSEAWWKIEKLDYNEQAVLVSRGTWLVNMNNVEAVKES